MRRIIFFISFFIITFCSCSSPKQVVVEERLCDTLVINKHDTLKVFDFKHTSDTLVQTHYFYITKDADGNVTHEKEVHDTYRSNVQNDSVDYYRSVADSLKKAKEQTKVETITIKEELGWFEKLKQSTWVYFFFISTLSTLYLVYIIKHK